MLLIFISFEDSYFYGERNEVLMKNLRRWPMTFLFLAIFSAIIFQSIEDWFVKYSVSLFGFIAVELSEK